ncbi:MAG: hypothetical protein QOI63_1308 [Thermoplasmata archaeon]|jgi:hypothetical protein|nr:hypothetical protein [Thermoplasmata archaeon]
MRALAGAALLLLLASGCLGFERVVCPAQVGGTFLIPPDVPATADPRVAVDLPVLVTRLNVSLAPQVSAQAQRQVGAASVPVERTEFNATGAQRLERLRLQPRDLAAPGGLVVRMDVADTLLPPKCGAAGGLGFTAGATLQEGRLLAPGHGAHVWYAGFWENGTLFETNIQGFDHSGWPRAGWYQSVPYDPLPVYVYDQSRSEQPASWKSAGQTVHGQAAGTPVDGPAQTATGPADATLGLGYYSTIKGFNDGLKGLSTYGARVLHMEAKDAYPAGAANNPLAGANLVFYVRLADVVDQPCPTLTLPAAAPCPQP